MSANGGNEAEIIINQNDVINELSDTSDIEITYFYDSRISDDMEECVSTCRDGEAGPSHPTADEMPSSSENGEIEKDSSKLKNASKAEKFKQLVILRNKLYVRAKELGEREVNFDNDEEEENLVYEEIHVQQMILRLEKSIRKAQAKENSNDMLTAFKCASLPVIIINNTGNSNIDKKLTELLETKRGPCMPIVSHDEVKKVCKLVRDEELINDKQTEIPDASDDYLFPSYVTHLTALISKTIRNIAYNEDLKHYSEFLPEENDVEVNQESNEDGYALTKVLKIISDGGLENMTNNETEDLIDEICLDSDDEEEDDEFEYEEDHLPTGVKKESATSAMEKNIVVVESTQEVEMEAIHRVEEQATIVLNSTMEDGIEDMDIAKEQENIIQKSEDERQSEVLDSLRKQEIREILTIMLNEPLRETNTKGNEKRADNNEKESKKENESMEELTAGEDKRLEEPKKDQKNGDRERSVETEVLDDVRREKLQRENADQTPIFYNLSEFQKGDDKVNNEIEVECVMDCSTTGGMTFSEEQKLQGVEFWLQSNDFLSNPNPSKDDFVIDDTPLAKKMKLEREPSLETSVLRSVYVNAQESQNDDDESSSKSLEILCCIPKRPSVHQPSNIELDAASLSRDSVEVLHVVKAMKVKSPQKLISPGRLLKKSKTAPKQEEGSSSSSNNRTSSSDSADIEILPSSSCRKILSVEDLRKRREAYHNKANASSTTLNNTQISPENKTNPCEWSTEAPKPDVSNRSPPCKLPSGNQVPALDFSSVLQSSQSQLISAIDDDIIVLD